MVSFPSIMLVYYGLLFLSLTRFGTLHVEGEEAESHHVVDIRSLLPGTVCSYSAKDFSVLNQTRLNVVHRHGPCSPLTHHHRPTHKQILDQDQSRVDSLHRRHSTASLQRKNKNKPKPKPVMATVIPSRIGTTLGTSNYIVTIGFGTPKRDLSVMFDTGSDITWIQCQPCVANCYKQQEPIFNPSQSFTYHNISCNSPYCLQLDTSSCATSTCLYTVQYGDSSYSMGFFAQDTLRLSPTDVILNFRFGCGEDNDGLFGKSAGLLGLGREPVSLISQSIHKYGGVFSYCLPPTSSSTGYLTLGSKLYSGVKYTPMLSESSMPSFYFVDLVAIIVAGKQLSIPQTVFSKAGTLMDSGTVISRLPPGAYSVLRSTFRKLMKKYPRAPALSILDTCYDFSRSATVAIPQIALKFRGGLVVSVDFSGILYTSSMSQVCLAFAGNSEASDVGIIGNVQQRRFNVVYDIPKSVIGFGPGGC